MANAPSIELSTSTSNDQARISLVCEDCGWCRCLAELQDGHMPVLRLLILFEGHSSLGHTGASLAVVEYPLPAQDMDAILEQAGPMLAVGWCEGVAMV